MSNQSFYLLSAAGVLLVFGFLTFIQKYLSAERKVEELTDRLAVVEGERDELSGLLMR